MKAILCLFDSLNRTALGCYGNTSIPTPNFDRFAKQSCRFDNHFVGSLPCIPARRDLHTGRMNFMHRSWGPLEPFDNSFPELIKKSNIYSHLITDHGHYFEDGGSTYHTRFSTYDFIRGQENDPWKAMVQAPLERFREKWHYDHMGSPGGEKGDGRVNDPARYRMQYQINKEWMQKEEELPGPRCYESALNFLDTNSKEDNWFLQLECFDPHEPFDAPDRFKKDFKTGWNGPILNWPLYEKVKYSPEEIAEIRANYAALVAMCDHYFGQLLDYMDANNMWDDTMLILTTDHGFLLSEHNWWGKNLQPYYREISHIPLIAHIPGLTKKEQVITSLTQTCDLMPTVLDFFNTEIPDEVKGKSLLEYFRSESSEKRYVAFGMFGGPIGVSDGRYDLYLYPTDLYAENFFEYTLMPTHIRSRMTSEELSTSKLSWDYSFTKGSPLLKIKALKNSKRIPNVDMLTNPNSVFENAGTRLFDTSNDPNQLKPISDSDIKQQLIQGLIEILESHECPIEIYSRFNLTKNKN